MNGMLAALMIGTQSSAAFWFYEKMSCHKQMPISCLWSSSGYTNTCGMSLLQTPAAVSVSESDLDVASCALQDRREKEIATELRAVALASGTDICR